MKKPISISFCISNNYAQHLAVVIASILLNNPDEDFVFHVVHHSVTPESKAKCVGVGLRVGANSSVTKNTEIGDYVTLNGVVIHGYGKTTIGSYTKIGEDTLIISQNHNYESDKLPYGGDYILKDVIIGECVWIGFGTIVLPGGKDRGWCDHSSRQRGSRRNSYVCHCRGESRQGFCMAR